MKPRMDTDGHGWGGRELREVTRMASQFALIREIRVNRLAHPCPSTISK